MRATCVFFNILIIVLISPMFIKSDESSIRNWLARISSGISDVTFMRLSRFAVLPLELASRTINAFCGSSIFSSIHPPKVEPDITKMRLKYMTAKFNYSVPLLESATLWNHPKFKKNRKLVIMATGWTNTVNKSSPLNMISTAFMSRHDVNFVVVDAAKYLDTFYMWAALNTEIIGRHIAEGLMNLLTINKTAHIHLIGHSLGAHTMGSAGRKFKRLTGQLLPRITGLDPANPCFRYKNSLPMLTDKDAELVDIIHTNIGVLGKREPIGHVDFYPAGSESVMPGCYNIGCSHNRAVEFFAESVYPSQEHNFIGWKCNSWHMLEDRTCHHNKTAIMGYMIDRKARGIYDVKVSRKSPYGHNLHGFESTDSIEH